MSTVSAFLDSRELPLRPEIDRLRTLISAGAPELVEGIKWNAPSFAIPGGDDCVTLKIHPPWTVQVILHRGSRTKPPRDLVVLDPAGLVRWVTSDRGVLTFKTMAEIDTAAPSFTRLVQAWVNAMHGDQPN